MVTPAATAASIPPSIPLTTGTPTPVTPETPGTTTPILRYSPAPTFTPTWLLKIHNGTAGATPNVVHTNVVELFKIQAADNLSKDAVAKMIAAVTNLESNAIMFKPPPSTTR